MVSASLIVGMDRAATTQAMSPINDSSNRWRQHLINQKHFFQVNL